MIVTGLTAELQEARKWFLGRAGGNPRAQELLERWYRLLDNPRYVDHLRVLRAFERGFDPFSGVDVAGYHPVDLLPTGTPLRLLLRGSRTYREDYFALLATVTALHIREPRGLQGQEAAAVYAKMDQVLGSEGSPYQTKDFFDKLHRVVCPPASNIFTPLDALIEVPGCHRFGRPFSSLKRIGWSACRVLTASVACKRASLTATGADGIEAGYAFIQLFE